MIPKVLLVDDVTMFLELQKMFLKLSSVHVLTARNGIEAIEVMLTSEGKIGDQALCYKSGCNGFLTKPLDRLQYLETARKYLPAIDRRDPRVPCRTKVKFRAYGVTLSGEAMNISTNGIFVVADYDFEVGTVLDLVFALPDETRAQIQTKGRVAWLNSAKGRLKDGLPGGFGVEFVAITEESRESLRQYVRENS